MKIKEGFVKREVMGKTVIVPTGEAGEAVKGMIKLNGTASFIWDQVAAGLEADEIAKLYREQFQIAEEKAKADVEAIIGQMKDVGVFD